MSYGINCGTLFHMLQDTMTQPRSSRGERHNQLATGQANAWLSWRPKRLRAVTVLSVAELAECTCPDLCDRDHQNE